MGGRGYSHETIAEAVVGSMTNKPTYSRTLTSTDSRQHLPAS